ncbi:MAG: ArsR/SmtB family transcription factor [Verrucomicrobiales bacterium]
MKTTDDWIPLLKALADPTRLELIRHLLIGEHTVEELAASLNATEYNISKHLRILRQAGVVVSSKDGRHLHNRVAPAFRKRIGRRRVLDLGCCSFRFD